MTRFFSESPFWLSIGTRSLPRGLCGKLSGRGVSPFASPPSAPNRNAQLERFIGSFKPEAADRLIFSGESHLQSVIDEYLDHYHREINHQRPEDKIIEPGRKVSRTKGNIRRRERLSAMFRYFYRDAT